MSKVQSLQNLISRQILEGGPKDTETLKKTLHL